MNPFGQDRADLATLGDLVREACNIVFFTGAGISTESGIADFRSPGGVWSRMKPIQFSDFVADEAVRLEDWRRRFHFQKQFDAAQPNSGHMAIARLAALGKVRSVITQNIDGLHQRSGIDERLIIEIHGNGTRVRCLNCGLGSALEEARQRLLETGAAPICTSCGGQLKSAVISFGQPMPQDRVAQAHAACQSCDLLVVAGSSLVVQPAASLPLVAMQSGARLAILNREPTPLDDLADVVVQRSIGDAMTHVMRHLDRHTSRPIPEVEQSSGH
jgi:NAD-dependent deacetylase